MATAIATWGNSEAVRIPRAVLREAGLRKGDQVEVRVNSAGIIEIAPLKRPHRRVAPTRGVTFDALFPDFDASAERPRMEPAWPNDDLIGAEWDAWAR